MSQVHILTRTVKSKLIKCLPAIGGPINEAAPCTKSNNPYAFVKASSEIKLTRITDTKA